MNEALSKVPGTLCTLSKSRAAWGEGGQVVKGPGYWMEDHCGDTGALGWIDWIRWIGVARVWVGMSGTHRKGILGSIT